MDRTDVEFEEDERPLHLRYRTLETLLQEYTPQNPPLDGETVMFEIDGIDPSEMLLLIYVRPPHPSRASIRDFPLIRLRLEGPLVDEATTKWIVSQQNCVDPGEDSASLMYGKGAFRTLIGYLERELPSRGFRGIFLEYVRNTKLRSAAERYGFTPTGLPVDLDLLKLLGP